mmetsp:Transcript_94185/g.130811  ORF Transcript_94185/g.130811 Transcript_94185/m.130811 type:complete len:95 (+) Transcript_94185:331-615(+)
MVVLRCNGLESTQSHGCQICPVNTAVFGAGVVYVSTAAHVENIEAAVVAGTGTDVIDAGVKHHFLVASLIEKSTVCSHVRSPQRTMRCCFDLMK